ncbi:hypothetical protein BOX15_Mlig010405g1 [Macrostomum lignano]|uniref:ABC transporter domain-containing protein n=2 Tax=Macrostomum lignano TaxID=282301 RepID=A0A267EIC8_9PLAT|nr:hypothetical protein BOX15_Mlig010405g1 [Macrostomum lignano]
MDKVKSAGRSRSPLKGYQMMTNPSLDADAASMVSGSVISGSFAAADSILQPASSQHQSAVPTAATTNHSAPISKSKLPFKPSRMSAAATSANSSTAAPAVPAAAASTASGGGSSGVGQDGIVASGSADSPRQSELGNRFVESAGQFLRDQLPTGLHLQRQQRRDAMGKPLLNLDGSQHSLRDVQLGVDATSPAASPLPVEAQVHNRTESGVSFDAPPPSHFRHDQPYQHQPHQQPQPAMLPVPQSGAKLSTVASFASTADGCYSRELAASNGDLSVGGVGGGGNSGAAESLQVVSRRSNRPRYEPGGSGSGGGDNGASTSSVFVNYDSIDTIPQDRRTSSSASRNGSVITFRNINYTVLVKRYPWSKAEKRVVLQSVSGIMRPGLNAIMGPTGSGKSSLLDVLAGRKDPQFLRGEVLVDGAEQPENFKCVSGYVVQDDIVMGTLTVRENLRFSAALRLPGSVTDLERRRKVESVIEELGLSKVADSKIGTELIRGVSGGERKRTNIGMELITDPSVLFLDEPTTGLDAFTAGSVLRTLRNLANAGRTIVFSIHQPKYSIYRLFDNLTLVVAGRIIYHGPAGDMPLRYFANIGYHCEAHNSPPDFFMDIVHGEVPVTNAGGEGGRAALISGGGSGGDFDDCNELPMIRQNFVPTAQVTKRDSVIDTDIQKSHSAAIGQQLIERWQQCPMAHRVEQQVEEIYQQSLRMGNGGEGSHVKVKKGAWVGYPTGLWNQVVWVSWRTALNLFRNPQSSIIQLVVYLFFGISIGTVFFGLDTSLESGIQNRQGLFFFLILQMVFVNLGAIEVFIKERVIFIHENSSGFYRVSVYFLAKIFCDMLPIKTLPVVLFMPIVYFMSRLKLDAGAFFFYELNLVLATCAACGVAFFVSASVSVFGIANIFISIIYVFMMVFGGFLMNISSMGDWLAWCKYFSVFNYAYAGLSVNEFVGLDFCPMRNTTNVTRTCKSGYVVLSDQQIAYKTGWDLWSNEFGMLLITMFFLALCYIQLRRIKKYK